MTMGWKRFGPSGVCLRVAWGAASTVNTLRRGRAGRWLSGTTRKKNLTVRQRRNIWGGENSFRLKTQKKCKKS